MQHEFRSCRRCTSGNAGKNGICWPCELELGDGPSIEAIRLSDPKPLCPHRFHSNDKIPGTDRPSSMSFCTRDYGHDGDHEPMHGHGGKPAREF